jgi:hypothetical protein
MASLKFTPRVWLSVGCVFGVATVVLALCYNHAPRRVNESGLAAVREGMTRHEVEDVLGGPPGDYTTRKAIVIRMWPGHANAAIYSGWTWEEWISDEGWITLTFDRDGTVIHKEFRPVDDLPDRPLLERAERFCRQVIGRTQR